MIPQTLTVLLGCLAISGTRALSLNSEALRTSKPELFARAGKFMAKKSKDEEKSKDSMCAPSGRKFRVACAGSSITEGSFSPGEKFPDMLQDLLGRDFDVENLGVIGKKVQKGSKDDWPSPYWLTEEFKKLQECKWDIVVLMMGTSDATDAGVDDSQQNWNHEFCDKENVSSRCQFWSDYDEFIKIVNSSGSAEIFLAVPPPVTIRAPWGINQTVVNSILPRMIPKLAKENAIRSDHIIDLFSALGGDRIKDLPEKGCDGDMQNNSICKWFCDTEYCDNVHPIVPGKKRMAEVVEDAIKRASIKIKARSKSSSRRRSATPKVQHYIGTEPPH